jgi:hypothetical protein
MVITFLSVSLTFFSFFFISGSNTVQQRTMIAGSSMSLQTNKEWNALPLLGPYYGKTWYIEREGEGAFDPIINQTPAQAAAAARLMPKPPNLETYATALSREEMDKTVVLEYGQFMPTDIQRADWIEAMIKDHKLAKHTANPLMMYPPLESHCPRCTEIHNHRHRNFSKEACIVLSVRELKDMGGSSRAHTSTAHRSQCTLGDFVQG